MSITVLTIFGLPVTAFGLGCALALLWYLLGLALWCRILRADYGVWVRLAVLSVPLSFMFARLTYVAVDFLGIFAASSYYLGTLENPALALRFWDGGYSLMGALFGLLIAAKLAEKWTRQRSKGVLMDAVGFAAPLAIMIERGFEYRTGMGIGREVESEWLIQTGLCAEVDGLYLHPVYLYEALTALVIFAVICVWMRRRKEHVPGDTLRLFLVLFGLSQVLLESFRADEHMIVHFVHAQQVMAIALCVGAMVSWTAKAVRNGRAGICVLMWLLTVIGIAAAIVAEFGVDRWGEPLMAYGLMIAGLLAVFASAMVLWFRANRTERQG